MKRMRTCQIEIPGKCMRRRGLAKRGLPQPIPVAPDPRNMSRLNARIDTMFADAAYDSVMKKCDDSESRSKNSGDQPRERRSDGLMREVGDTGASEHDNEAGPRVPYTRSLKSFELATQALDKPQ